jgi:hypothetical protein
MGLFTPEGGEFNSSFSSSFPKTPQSTPHHPKHFESGVSSAPGSAACGRGAGIVRMDIVLNVEVRLQVVVRLFAV